MDQHIENLKAYAKQSHVIQTDELLKEFFSPVNVKSIIKNYPEKIKTIPKKFLTNDMVDYIIFNHGVKHLLKTFNYCGHIENKYDIKILLDYLRIKPSAIDKVPVNIITLEMIKIVCIKNVMCLKNCLSKLSGLFVEEDNMSFIFEMIQKNPSIYEFLPIKIRHMSAVMIKTVQTNGLMLEKISESERISTLCKLALKNNINAYDFLPNHFKTSEKFFTDWFE